MSAAISSNEQFFPISEAELLGGSLSGRRRRARSMPSVCSLRIVSTLGVGVSPWKTARTMAGERIAVGQPNLMRDTCRLCLRKSRRKFAQVGEKQPAHPGQ